MSERTPLPWHVGSNSFGTQFIYGNPAEPRTSPMGVRYNDLVCGGDHPSTLTDANASFIVEAVNSHHQLLDFMRWVDSWVSNPVGAYSVDALDGLFGMTRDKIEALRRLGAVGTPSHE